MLNTRATRMNTTLKPDQSRQMVEKLNHLAKLNKESSDGFEMAAELAENDRYQKLFREYAAQRQQFAAELMNLVVSHGGEPETGLDVESLFQNLWLGIKNIVKGDDTALMDTCAESEETLLTAYQDTLEWNDMPENEADRLKTQQSHIRIAQEKLSNLTKVLA